MSRTFFTIVAYIIGAVTGNWWVFASALMGEHAAHQQRRDQRRARDAYNASLQDRMIMLDLQPDAARTLVLGRVRAVEGIRRRWSSGEHNAKLTLIVSFAGHEIDAFETFYFNDTALTLNGPGYVLTPPYLKSPIITEQERITLDGSGVGTLDLGEMPLAGSVSAVWHPAVDGYIDQPCAVEVVGNIVTVTGTFGSELMDATVMWQTVRGASTARIRTYLGTAGQNVGADLAAEYPGKLTATDKFAGIALAVIDLEYDPDVYPQGIPNITAVMRGAKCLDPRTGVTAWTENPALHAYHYARWSQGWAVPADEIRVGDIVAAADVCDFETAFTLRKSDGSTSTVTLPRYRSGIVIASDAEPRASMDSIMEAMAGRWGWAGGTWRMRAGAMASPLWHLQPNWVAQRVGADGMPEPGSVVRISNGITRDQKVNRITGACVDPAQRWQVLPFPAVQDPVLIASEGLYPVELTHQAVNHVAHAQHLATVTIRQVQAALRMELSCNLNAYRCELFDVGTVTLPRYGMDAKTAEVTGWRWHPTEGIKLRLAEITPEIFTPVAELVGRDPAPNSSLPPPWAVEAITGVVVTSGTTELTDGSVITRTKVAWDPVVAESIRVGGQVEVQYIEVGGDIDVDWPSWVEQGSVTSATIPGLLTRRHYLFRVRAINAAFNVKGPWSLQVLHLVAEPPAAADSITVEYSVTGTDGWHSTFADGDLYARYRFGDGDWGDAIRIVGEGGTDGDYFDYRFKRAATIPATPTGAEPAGWFDAPPAADGNPLWASFAKKSAAGALIGAWSTPTRLTGDDGADGADGADGTDGDGIEVQYSIDGSSGWHSTFVDGDLYARWRLGTGAWSDVFKIVGEDGVAGATGNHTSFIFRRAATIPATPTGDTPAGWSDAPPADDGNALWASYAQKDAANHLVGAWSTPVKISGDNAKGIRCQSTGGNVFLTSGSGTSSTPSSINIRRLLSGGLTVAGGTTTWSVVSGTFTGSLSVIHPTEGWFPAFGTDKMTTDAVTFRCSHVEGGITYTDDITIYKSRDAVSGYLTNDAVALPATSAGAITSYGAANGTFKVVNGAGDVATPALAFTIIGHTGFNASFSTPGPSQLGGLVSVNASSGAYQVSGAIPDASTMATVTIQATYTDPLGGTKTIPRVFTITKSQQGTQGNTGSTGSPGSQGVSARRAYALYSGNPSVTGGPVTKGGTGLPATTDFAPTSATAFTTTTQTPGTAQALFQSDGLYDPVANNTVWNTPYLSNFKVGQLSAIASDIGTITAGTVSGVTFNITTGGALNFFDASNSVQLGKIETGSLTGGGGSSTMIVSSAVNNKGVALKASNSVGTASLEVRAIPSFNQTSIILNSPATGGSVLIQSQQGDLSVSAVNGFSAANLGLVASNGGTVSITAGVFRVNIASTTGSGTANFPGNNKPGGTSTCEWLPINVNGAQKYLPVWG